MVLFAYNRPIDADAAWKAAAEALAAQLGPDVVVIGRSRRVQIAVGGVPGARVEEALEIPCEPPLRLELVQLEGEFSQPNGAVLATELTKPNAAVARENAAKNGRSNVVVARLSAAEVAEALRRDREFARLKELGVDLDAYDLGTLFVDPPRCGLEAPTLKLAPRPTVVYMSCGPDTLAENLHALNATHVVADFAVFDQFPYTDHCEPVKRVSKVSATLGDIPGGDEIWDPLELAQWRDVEELRATELANGRAAMLAFVGWIWPQVFGLWKGGPVTSSDPIAALTEVPTVAWVQFIVFCGAIEANRLNYDRGLERDTSKVFFDPLGLYPEDAEARPACSSRSSRTRARR
ncbi:S-adenosylmethionine-dependent tRNA (m5U54) methyltransferase [Aureococcus anophagefferens]|nr:S-adenosylmethionine-dependent tRNA (m5U54) methyltransferase [Aureococcus anophagefferens]